MSETTTEAPAQEPVSENTESTETTENVKATEDTTDWKAESRKWEARSKANSEAAAKLAKIEADQAAKEAESAKAETDALKLDATRYRTAAAHGISAEDADIFLLGKDEASITAQAERLSAILSATPAARAPQPNPGQGSVEPQQSKSGMAAFASALFGSAQD